jgi:hypothetical protein
MPQYSTFRFILVFAFVLSLAGTLPAQSTRPPDKALVVNGKIIGTGVHQIDGHSYVDIEALAQITNAVVTVEPNRIVLTIPVSESSPARANPTRPVKRVCARCHRRSRRDA